MNTSQHVKKWRNSTKERIILAMGGECQCCGYKKSQTALELHHLDPTEKEFSFGAVMANPKSWLKIVIELRKCILVCANCHREIHSGITQVPEKFAIFDESFVNYKPQTETHNNCPVCQKPKPIQNKTCSLSCAGRKREKADWSKIDLYDLYFVQKISMTDIGDKIGVSGGAVWKKLQKLKTPTLGLEPNLPG